MPVLKNVRHREANMDWEGFPYYSGQGTVHDLRDAEGREPRLWFAKSVSKAAAIAMHTEPRVKQRRIGFRLPPRANGKA